MTENANNDTNWVCHRCGKPAFKSDGQCVLWCEKCLDSVLKPRPCNVSKTPDRNKLCPCGSQLKYKRCCGK